MGSVALTKTSPSQILDLWLRENQKRGDKSCGDTMPPRKDWDNININEHFNVGGVSVPSFKLLFYFVSYFVLASSFMCL